MSKLWLRPCFRSGSARFGKAHHCDPLVRTEVVGVQEGVDPRRLAATNALYQRPRCSKRLTRLRGRQPGLAETLRDDLFFVGPISAAERAAIDARSRAC